MAADSEVGQGGSTLLQWSTQAADSCTASGAWTGNKATSGSETVGPLMADSTYTLHCSNAAGEVQSQVVVRVTAATQGGAGFEGVVDSSFIDRDGRNELYIFRGNVTPDDVDGDSGDPIVRIEVRQDLNACTWGTASTALSPGDYTLAFTNQAQLDDPLAQDTISFQKVVNFTVGNHTQVVNVEPDVILRVGPGERYSKPSDVIPDLTDGAVVEIAAGTYLDDIVVWRNNNITLRGVNGRAHIEATSEIPYTPGSDRENGMGIWVIKARNIRVENMEFSGARVPDLNGAGIRDQGPDMTVCNGYFHDNENGILGGGRHTRIEYSEFYNNGLGEYGRTHNMYIQTDILTLRYSYSHHANIGHNVKTRARVNYIYYNRIMDGADGTASYAIDISNGGLSYIVGNLIQQGPNTDNRSTVIAYGAEGLSNPGPHKLYVVNNTFVNDVGTGTFVSQAGGTEKALISNNLFVGGGRIANSGAIISSNLETNSPLFQDQSNYNYRLTAASPAADAGQAPPISDEGIDLVPHYQYRNDAQTEPRPTDARIDIGGYELP